MRLALFTLPIFIAFSLNLNAQNNAVNIKNGNYFHEVKRDVNIKVFEQHYHYPKQKVTLKYDSSYIDLTDQEVDQIYTKFIQEKKSKLYKIIDYYYAKANYSIDTNSILSLKYLYNVLSLAKENNLSKNLVYAKIANNYLKNNRIDTAKYYIKCALNNLTDKMPKNNLAEIYFNISNYYSNIDSYRIAIFYDSLSLNAKKQIFNTNDARIADSFYSIAKNYSKSMEFLEQAIAYYQKSIEIRESHPPNINLVHSYLGLGYCFWKQRDYSNSLFYSTKARDILISIEDTTSWDMADANYDIALNLHYLGLPSDSTIPIILKSIQILENYESEEKKIGAYKLLSEIFESNEDFEKSIHYYEKILQISKRYRGANNLKVANNYFQLGHLHKKNQQLNKAKDSFNQAAIIYKTLLKKNIDSLQLCTQLCRIFGELKAYNTSNQYANMALMLLKDNTTLKKMNLHFFKFLNFYYSNSLDSALFEGDSIIKNEILINDYSHLPFIYETIGDIHNRLNNFEQSSKYYKIAHSKNHNHLNFQLLLKLISQKNITPEHKINMIYEALEHHNENRSNNELCNLYLLLGENQFSIRDLQKSKFYLNKVLDTQIKKTSESVTVLKFKANIYLALILFTERDMEFSTYVNSSQELYSQIQNKTEIINTFYYFSKILKGINHYFQDEVLEAKMNLNLGLSNFHKIEGTPNRNVMLFIKVITNKTLASIYHEEQKYSLSKLCLDKTLSSLNSIDTNINFNTEELRLDLLISYTDFFYEQDKMDSALFYIDKSLNYINAKKIKYPTYNLLYKKAKILLLNKNKKKEALNIIENQIKKYENQVAENIYKWELEDLYQLSAEYNFNEENYIEAIYYYSKYIEVNEIIPPYEIYFQRAYCYLKLKKYEAFQNNYDTICSLYDNELIEKKNDTIFYVKKFERTIIEEYYLSKKYQLERFIVELIYQNKLKKAKEFINDYRNDFGSDCHYFNALLFSQEKKPNIAVELLESLESSGDITYEQLKKEKLFNSLKKMKPYQLLLKRLKNK